MSTTTKQIPLTDAVQLRNLIAAREISPVEVVESSLERAAEVHEALNIFVNMTPGLAMEAARDAERRLLRGEDLGPLGGVPVTVKDNLNVAGVPTTSGSVILKDNIAATDSPSVARLRKAGACIIGKTTLPEFATKAVGDSPLTGITRNPWNPEKTPGGSSSGAAAGVAAGVAPLALVTDGGGSTRVPASFCGVFGIKPQFGRVPYVPISATPTMSHIGVLSNSVQDAKLMLEVVSGGDLTDPSAIPCGPLKLGNLGRRIDGLRIAFSPTLGYANPQPEVVDAVQRATQVFAEELGCTVETVDSIFPDPSAIWDAEFMAGAGSRLAPIIDKHGDKMDQAVVKQVLRGVGGQTLGEYLAKSSEKFELREKLRQFFEEYDLLITPTLPVTAFDVGRNAPEGYPDPEDDPLAWVDYLSVFNTTGNPAASVPCGFDATGLPIGMQVVGPSFMEASVLRAAAAYESVRPWALHRPPAFA